MSSENYRFPDEVDGAENEENTAIEIETEGEIDLEVVDDTETVADNVIDCVGVEVIETEAAIVIDAVVVLEIVAVIVGEGVCDGGAVTVADVEADAVTQNQDGTYSLRFPRFLRFRDFEAGDKV
jgi:hypothetical protein